MDCRCTIPHMRGKVVRVNGKAYELDEDGVASFSKADGEKLLLCKGWVSCQPQAAEEDPEKPEEIEEPPEGQDEEQDPEVEEKDLEKMDLEELKALADEMEISYGPRIGNAALIERIKEARE